MLLTVLATLPELGDPRSSWPPWWAWPQTLDSGTCAGTVTAGSGGFRRGGALHGELSATRCNPQFEPFYERLIAKGSPRRSP